MYQRTTLTILALLIAMLLNSGTALAHHPLAGMPMSTFTHGILSGLAHPVIGIDHLFFVVAVGIVALYTRSALLSPVYYIVGMLFGITITVAGVQLSHVEIAIALSLLLLGAIIASGHAMSTIQSWSLLSFLGLFHGYAFGESITGVESITEMVWAGYLIGLCSIQWSIAVLAGYLVSKAWTQIDSTTLRPRLVGAVTLGVGFTFFIEIAETLVLQSL